ncbi:phosphatase PAP2 family protein [Ruminococcaceae bacterium OttesenSCG-928-A16]|nr:phosphatase PAP2 family protein [Ruminococcaceae bacterium OttesenSCG-928-A16]
MARHKNKNVPTWLAIALLVYLVGFVLAARYDLAINTALYTPTNTFAIIMEAFGWYPTFIIAVFYALLWLTKPAAQRKWWQAAAGGLVGFGGLIALHIYALHHLVKRGWFASVTSLRALPWLAGTLVLGALLWLAAYKAPLALRPKLQFFGFWGSVYMLANQAVIYPIKTLWQRTRFDDMVAAGSFDAFTPWYRPLGGGGSSFPSGHTANAAGVFVLIILCDLFPAWHKKRRWVYAGIWGYILFMAFARVLIGRHYVSDTLAASAIMAILFFILRRTRWYKQGLAALTTAKTTTQESVHEV